jgi:CRP/FNR family transcriptional regulator
LKDILRKTKRCKGFDEKSLDELVLAASIKTAAKGEIIFYEKDPAYAFYVIEKGKVKVFKMSPDGKEQILMIANDGDTFAEAAMFTGGIYPASAQTLEKTELMVINRDRFVNILERNPHIAMNLIARLSELLHKLNRLVEELSLTDITTRLAHYIVNEIDSHDLNVKESGTNSNYKLSLTLKEKKSTLASQLGTIPETLSRSFAKLSKEKVISVDGADIEILDYDHLSNIAGQ